jgi:hypothetical protein
MWSIWLFEATGVTLVLLGTALGAAGTLLICKQYHPFSPGGFAIHFLRFFPFLLRHGWTKAKPLIGIAASIASLNQEQRSRALLGLYLVSLGFAIQTAGVVCALIIVLIRDTAAN